MSCIVCSIGNALGSVGCAVGSAVSSVGSAVGNVVCYVMSNPQTLLDIAGSAVGIPPFVTNIAYNALVGPSGSSGGARPMGGSAGYGATVPAGAAVNPAQSAPSELTSNAAPSSKPTDVTPLQASAAPPVGAIPAAFASGGTTTDTSAFAPLAALTSGAPLGSCYTCSPFAPLVNLGNAKIPVGMAPHELVSQDPGHHSRLACVRHPLEYGHLLPLSCTTFAARGGEIGALPSTKSGEHRPEFVTGETGYYACGRGTGQSDDIPALLRDGDYVMDADSVAAFGDGSSKAGAQVMEHFRRGLPVDRESTGKPIPAQIADGEYVLPEPFVTALGGGDNKRGAKMLDGMREELRAHKRSAPDGKIPPKAKSPLEYLKMAEG